MSDAPKKPITQRESEIERLKFVLDEAVAKGKAHLLIEHAVSHRNYARLPPGEGFVHPQVDMAMSDVLYALAELTKVLNKVEPLP